MATSSSNVVNEGIVTTKKEKEAIQNKASRYLFIDVFRGLAIIAMIFVNVIAPFDRVPAWSKHALDYVPGIVSVVILWTHVMKLG